MRDLICLGANSIVSLASKGYLVSPTNSLTLRNAGPYNRISRVWRLNYTHFCDFSPTIATIPTIFAGKHVKSLEISYETLI